MNTHQGDGDARNENETGIRIVDVAGHVGFDSLPIVAQNAIQQRGYDFNLLCIGETGIGKTTLVNSLFNINSENAHDDCSMVVDLNCDTPASDGLSGNLSVKYHELFENGFKLNLTVVETVGYGDQLNKEDSYGAIQEYIEKQYEAYFREELKINRCLPLYKDTRIHVCLYFISPTGKGLKGTDLLCLKKLHDKVNLVPVIGKADAMSKAELSISKEQIRNELEANGIAIYNFPDDDDDCLTCKTMCADLPFAVVGSQEFVFNGQKSVRGRSYPWGNVIVEDETHCDFVKLRELLIRTNMDDLKEQTHQHHYENYRMARLNQMGFNDDDSDGTSFKEMCERKLHIQFQEFAHKENEMKQRMVAKIKTTEDEMNEKERQIRSKYGPIHDEQLREMQQLQHYISLITNEIEEFHKLTAQHATTHQQSQKKLGGNSKSGFTVGSLGRPKKSA